jgi:hypothetical protein
MEKAACQLPALPAQTVTTPWHDDHRRKKQCQEDDAADRI